jgi:hypothetical protein
MSGIIDGPANVLCDNDSIVKKSNIPSFTLKKKHNAIHYHRVREADAAKMMHLPYVLSGQNMAGMLTI